MIVTANQNPFPVEYAYHVNGSFAPHYREQQIRALLTGRTGWKAPDMLTVQKDVYSPLNHFLARQAVAAYDRVNPKPAGLDQAIGLLRNWNGQMEIGQAAPLVARLLYDQVKSTAADKAAPNKGGLYKFQMGAAALERLLRERPAGWFADYDKMLLGCLRDAFDQAERQQGRNPAKWDYGRWQTWTLEHPVMSRVPLVGGFFAGKPQPMSGTSFTVKQVNAKLGPSMRMSADLGDLDRSLQNIVVGQSGHVLSSHYKDQWQRYWVGESFPMQFRQVDSKDRLTLEPAK